MKLLRLQRILFVTLLLFAAPCLAAQDWLIASRTDLIGVGQKIELEVVKPDEVSSWPENLPLKLSRDGAEEVITLSAKNGNTSASRRVYTGRPQRQFLGVVHAELVEQPSNRILLLAKDEAGNAPTVAAREVAEETNRPVVVLAQPGDEPALSAYEPAYFVAGANSKHGKDAKFQISFKYRLFDPKSSIADFSPMLSNLYFTYTQTTVWDLGGDSSPFRDTSYKPGIFYRLLGRDETWWPEQYDLGLEHESNGQSGKDSRAINTAYVRPTWNWDLDNGKRLTFYPKIYGYLTKRENEDIQKYRGYVDWQMRYGREDGFMVNALYRQGTGGYMTGQLDFSYPLSERIFARTGAFLHLQLFSGYGETLLDYNHENDTQLRVGISLIR